MATVIRIVVLYLFIIIALRVMGKREFSELSPLELVTLLLIPELASQAVLGEDFSMTNALIALSALFTLVFLSALTQFHFRKVGKLVNGTPSVLVFDGQMYLEQLELERITEEEVLSEVQKAGLTSVEDAEWVILQTDGRMAVIPKHTRVAQRP